MKSSNHRLEQALFFFVYRRFLRPVLMGALRVLAIFNRKVKLGLQMREADSRGTLPWLGWSKEERPIWFHCASGEFEYAKPVITALKQQSPSCKILVTYFSPTYAANIAKFPGVDFSTPAPWDNPEDMIAFLRHHRPRALLIARTDTWPEMIHQSRRLHIPTLLFAATLPPESGRSKGLGRWLARAIFSDLSMIYCVSDEDRRTFASLGFKAEVAGDTRYDQVMARLENPKPLREELFEGIDPKRILVAGSTWEEDEEILAEVAAQLQRKLRFVIVPHEPTEHHLGELERALQTHRLKFVRYSKTEKWEVDEVLIVDQVGILAELYQKGRYAFVGGSFKKTVHSVMESLAAGCLTFVGPYYRNNREADEFTRLRTSADSPTYVQSVKDEVGFVSVLKKTMALPNVELDRISQSIREEIQVRSGRSGQVVNWVLMNAQPVLDTRKDSLNDVQVLTPKTQVSGGQTSSSTPHR